MSIGNCCQTIGNSLDSCFSAIGSGLSSCGGFVSDSCSTIGNGIGSGCSAIGNGISSCCTSFTTCITTFATDTVWPVVQSVIAAVCGFFQSIGNWIADHKEFSIGTGIGCIAGIVMTALSAWFCCKDDNALPGGNQGASAAQQTVEHDEQTGRRSVTTESSLDEETATPLLGSRDGAAVGDQGQAALDGQSPRPDSRSSHKSGE